MPTPFQHSSQQHANSRHSNTFHAQPSLPQQATSNFPAFAPSFHSQLSRPHQRPPPTPTPTTNNFATFAPTCMHSSICWNSIPIAATPNTFHSITFHSERSPWSKLWETRWWFCCCGSGYNHLSRQAGVFGSLHYHTRALEHCMP